MSSPVTRILVCGGRTYEDKELVFAVLDELKQRHPSWNLLIHGGAKGADSLADKWARTTNGVQLIDIYRPQWELYGRNAGPRRNELMLRDGCPDLVVAFPGGRGTAHMVRVAKEAGVEVIEIV